MRREGQLFNPADRHYFIESMMCKFLDSGYGKDELFAAKDEALCVDRVTVIKSANTTLVSPNLQSSDESITFVINHDRIGSSQIRNIVRDNQEMINYLFGREIKAIAAERRNPNTASLLFAKSGFAKEECKSLITQKCRHGGV